MKSRKARIDLGADAEDRLLTRGAQPQVPVIHEEVGAVLLGRDRIGSGDRDQLDRAQPHLDAAGRARVGAQRRRAPSTADSWVEPLARLPVLRDETSFTPATHCITPAAVADHQELDLSARAPVSHPSPQLDLGADVSQRVPDPIHGPEEGSGTRRRALRVPVLGDPCRYRRGPGGGGGGSRNG